MGPPRGMGWASWLVAMQPQVLKVTPECAWPRLLVGCSFLCDLERVTSSELAAFPCVRKDSRQLFRPDRAGLA
jgi:hypothetical protein